MIDESTNNLGTINPFRYRSLLGYNLHSYCENNPVNIVDPSGNDAILVVDYNYRSGLPILGHMALEIQANNGKWYLIEYTEKRLKDAKVHVDKISGDFKGNQSFWKSFLSGYGIDGFQELYIEGDFTKSLEYANEYKDGDYGGYKLLKNNCLHFVRNALRHEKCKNGLLQLYFMMSTTIIPIVFFCNVQIVMNMKTTFLNKIKIMGCYYA